MNEQNPEKSFQSNKQELINLGENIAEIIRSLKESKRKVLILNTLLPSKEIFTADEAKIHLREIKSSFEQILIEIQQELPLDNSVDIVKSIFTSIGDLNISESIANNQLLRFIDNILLDVINNREISITVKDALFNKIKKLTDDRFIELIQRRYQGDTDQILPTNFTYVLNPEITQDRDLVLNTIRQEIKRRASDLIARYERLTINDSLNENTLEDPLSQEFEEYLAENAFNQAQNTTIEEYIPLSNTSDFSALKKVLVGEEVTEQEGILAELQLLKTYREYVNLKVQEARVDNRIVSEQIQDMEGSLRIGESSSPERERFTRRYALFNMWHAGQINENELNPNSERKNLVPVSKEALELFEQDENIIIEAKNLTNQLSSEQLRRFDEIRKFANFRIAEDGNVTGNSSEFIDTPHIPSQIINRVLQKLGIKNSDEINNSQIQKAKNATPPDDTKTFGLYIKPKANTAIDTLRRLFIISENLNNKLYKFMATVAHETGHIIQLVARDKSILPGLEKLPGVGRSGILAESGAIKLEAIMKGLFGEQRDVTSDLFLIVKLLSEGKTYWEIFDEFFKILKLKNQDENGGQSDKDIIIYAERNIRRIYNELGAMADGEKNFRSLTSTEGLSYLYQGLSKYSDLPYYLSGIPVQIPNLAVFLGTPKVNDEIIDEAKIIGSVIDATYEALKEAGIITN